MIGQRSRLYRVLVGGSFLLILSALIVLKSTFVQVTFSVLAFILPLLVGAWFIVLMIYALYTYTVERSTWLKSLILVLSFLLITILLWPQFWLFRTADSVDQVRPLLKHETAISLMTWNLQRFGDLGK